MLNCVFLQKNLDLAVKEEAGVKTLENGLMVFTTKELYSKRLSLCV